MSMMFPALRGATHSHKDGPQLFPCLRQPTLQLNLTLSTQHLTLHTSHLPPGFFILQDNTLRASVREARPHSNSLHPVTQPWVFSRERTRTPEAMTMRTVKLSLARRRHLPLPTHTLLLHRTIRTRTRPQHTAAVTTRTVKKSRPQ